MRIAIGCDHAGFALKAPLTTSLEVDSHDVLDLGTFSTDPVDYPDFAKSVGQAVLRGFVDVGILVCGSGVGASIAANKLRGIRAALCHDLFTARQSREDDDANVLCLGARVLDEGTAIEVARAWLGRASPRRSATRDGWPRSRQLEVGSEAPAAAARPAAARPAAPAASPPPRPPTPSVAPEPARAAANPPRAAAPSPPPPAPVATPPTPARRPSADPDPPRQQPGDSLAARAAELIRQFTEKHPEDTPARPEGVISIGDDDEIEVVMPEPQGSPARAEAGAGGAAGAQRPRVTAGRGGSRPGNRGAASGASGDAAARARAGEGRAAPAAGAAEAPRRVQAPRRAGRAPPARGRRLPRAHLGQGRAAGGATWRRSATGWAGSRRRRSCASTPTTSAGSPTRSGGCSTHVILLGMGGSSLAAEALNAAFGAKLGFPDMLLLDSTDPVGVARVRAAIDPAKTLFVVSTKSGNTTETLSFSLPTSRRRCARRASRAGRNFVAITDPNSPLESLAPLGRYRRTFLNAPDVGGRYSALTYFGLVPAALAGIDLAALLERALALLKACGPRAQSRRTRASCSARSSARLARAGRDKLTLVVDPRSRRSARGSSSCRREHGQARQGHRARRRRAARRARRLRRRTACSSRVGAGRPAVRRDQRAARRARRGGAPGDGSPHVPRLEDLGGEFVALGGRDRGRPARFSA